MLHARVIRPPVYDAKLEKLDEEAMLKQFPGITKTVVNGSFIGIVSNNEYTVVKAQTEGENFTKWSTVAPLLPVDPISLQQHLKNIAAPETRNVKTKGKVDINRTTDAQVVTASYFKPYLMHGSIGPSCAVAFYDKDMLHIWTHSQGIYPLREALRKLFDIQTDKIHITGVPGSGCYGHNGADDVAAEAAVIAIAYPGKHIRLQWSRSDEHRWEPYGSAMIMEIAAKLNKDGKITDWKYDLWSDSHSSRPGGNPENILPARYIRKPFIGKPAGFSGGAYRNAEPYYAIPNLQIDYHAFNGPLRVSALRSLGAYGNIFAIESFMDELAEKAGKDPFTFRLMHLEDDRAKAVLRKLKEMLPPKTGKGSGIGIAFSRYKNTASYCAVAAEVVVDKKTGEISVKKMWSAIDAGEAINTDGLINQTEGGMIQAASWTLQEQVRFDKNSINSIDWESYPIFRFRQSPETKVVVLNNPEQGPMGAGEAAQGPAGAAVANAVYKACGKRFRDLPIVKETIKAF
jgi:CO/xanthine dehydrogenase Mo-binding subunit